MKLSTLIASYDALTELAKQKVTARLAFQISRIAETVHTEVARFEKIRAETVEKYGEKAEGANYRIPQENVQLFTKEIGDLLDTEIDFNPVKIPVDALGDVKLSAQEIILLDWLITE